jgi:hypothetical protein
VGSNWLQARGSDPLAHRARASGAESRGGAAGTTGVAAAAPRISIAWVGDITPGSSYGLPPDGGRPLFAAVRSWLRAPDLTLGNLEGTLSVGGGSKCGAGGPNCFAFQAPPENGRALRWAGFDAVNLANNHSFDFGPQGQAQTVAALRAARVRFTGRPGEIRVVRRRGVRIALVGFAPYPWAASMNDIPRARRLVAAAGRRADVMVAFIHAGAEGADQMRTPWGTEFAFGEDRGDTRGFAHAVVDAGADLVLGSGPHVIRGVERYRGRLIAYSLGNFAGWDNFPGGGALSLSGIFRVTLRRDGVPTAGRWLPVRLVGPGTPEPDPTKASAMLAAQLSRDDFGTAAGMRPSGRLSVPRGATRR